LSAAKTSLLRTRDLLLDTHVLVWMATDPDRIEIHLLHAVEEASHRFVSHVTALEIQIKHQKNPKAFPFSLHYLEQSMKEFSCQELPITYSDIQKLDQMEFLHSDPFDRILMAQSASRNVRLITLDEDILRTAKRYKSFTT
jgi:PIN domain nuclease of toxin-antitoxin system